METNAWNNYHDQEDLRANEAVGTIGEIERAYSRCRNECVRNLLTSLSRSGKWHYAQGREMNKNSAGRPFNADFADITVT